jgi:integrase
MANLVRRDRATFEELKRLAVDGVSSPHSRHAYAAAIDEFLAWWKQQGRPPFTKATVQAYRATLETAGLAAATLNLRLTALRKLAAEAADNGMLAPAIAAGIARIRGARRLGARRGNWITRGQAQALLEAPDAATAKGRRDRAILAVLLGCALRRGELAALCLEDIRQRDGRWVIADLAGKGGRPRHEERLTTRCADQRSAIAASTTMISMEMISMTTAYIHVPRPPSDLSGTPIA